MRPMARNAPPFEVDISSVIHPWSNSVAVRVDHRRLSELNLGGILRPVYLVQKPGDNRGKRLSHIACQSVIVFRFHPLVKLTSGSIGRTPGI